ncbi:hypothetical protein [Caenimonas sedimenti]|uniref:hypothetical protein n=1 Tax=Caenimonas sedimenti TaxID=2596921 RepID=UPI002107FA84|nr:hypothetical protein [Caenimonas sedimenti]
MASLAVAVPWSHAAAADPSLTGCWRAVKIILHAQDGSKTEDVSGRCTLHFKDAEFESVCGTSAGRAVRSTYAYRIVRPGFYSATMTRSSFRTDLAGSAREYEYRVEGDRLRTVTQPQAHLPVAPAGAGRVETEAARMPCP